MMKLKTYIPFALILLLPALLPEAAALRAQTSRNSFLKVSVGDIRYVDKAQNKKQTVGSILTDLATTAVTGKSTTQHDEYAPSVREAIVKALSDVTRFRVIDGDFHFNELAGTSQVTPSTVKDKPAEQAYKVLINATLNLKDARTDEAVKAFDMWMKKDDKIEY